MAEEHNDISEEMLEECVKELSGGRRRSRQEASHVIARVAANDPDRLVGYVDSLVDALYRPEAQTRWEVLDALSRMAADHADLVAPACDGAEAALFDETSSAVRLAAFKFLTRYGISSPQCSNEVWGLLDEAIQCYHGDPEYRDMLGYLLDFAKGDLSEETSSALAARVSFDAERGSGYIKAFSGDILKAIGAQSPEEGE